MESKFADKNRVIENLIIADEEASNVLDDYGYYGIQNHKGDKWETEIDKYGKVSSIRWIDSYSLYDTDDLSVIEMTDKYLVIVDLWDNGEVIRIFHASDRVNDLDMLVEE